jgi:hypothetical protein
MNTTKFKDTKLRKGPNNFWVASEEVLCVFLVDTSQDCWHSRMIVDSKELGLCLLSLAAIKNGRVGYKRFSTRRYTTGCILISCHLALSTRATLRWVLSVRWISDEGPLGRDYVARSYRITSLEGASSLLKISHMQVFPLCDKAYVGAAD